MQTFIDDCQVFCSLKKFVVVTTEKTADIGQCVFFCRHCAAIGQIANLPQDGFDRFSRVSSFPFPDKKRVFYRPGRVQHDEYAFLAAIAVQRFQVFHREWLTAGHVYITFETDIRDTISADFLYQLIQLCEIYIALERMAGLGVVGFVDDDIDELAAGEFLVQPGRREVHIPRDKVAWFDQQLRHDVLCATPLVGRQQVPVTVILPDDLLQAIKTFAAGIGFVAAHEPGPLPVAHRRCARIGQQIDIDIATS